MTVLTLLWLVFLSPLGSALYFKAPEPDSKWSFADRQHPPKKQLLFLHFEKSAGSYVDDVFKAVVGSQDYMSYHNCGVPITDVPSDYFVVASIREPCDQAVSQWEYECEKTYLKRVYGQEDSAANYQYQEEHGMCPTFIANQSGTGNKWVAFPVDPNYEGFHASGVTAAGAYQRQIMGNLQNIGWERVNCWVRFENLQDSMSRCLQEFTEATGKPINKDLIPSASLASHTAAQGTESHHGACKDYFPNTTVGLDAQRSVRTANAELYKYFNFRCCE